MHTFSYEMYQGLEFQRLRDPGASGIIDHGNEGMANCHVVTAGAEARTLRGPSRAGQIFTVALDVAGGALTLTVQDSAGNTDDTLTMSAARNFATFIAVEGGTTLYWQILGSSGVGGVDGTVFDTLTVNTTLTLATANIDFDGAGDILIDANTAAALEVSDGTTKLLAFDSRNTVKNASTVTITASAPTIASEAAAHVNASLALAAKTITYTGTTNTTSQLGGMLHIGALTITDASAMTLATASSVHITALAAAGGMLTITASHMISTSVADAYLTNAGVWTDTMCWEYLKENVSRGYDAACGVIEDILRQIIPATWKYKDVVEMPSVEPDAVNGVIQMAMNDYDRQRVGIIYNDLPDQLRAPGEKEGVASGFLASFCLAAVKMLYDRNVELEARLAALEA